MIFKAIRHLIFSPLVLIVDGEEIDNVEVNDPAIDIYDYYEVIGIRSWAFTEDDGAVVISLKPTITSYYEDAVSKKINNSYESGFICKK
jgi:hypothetical protein